MTCSLSTDPDERAEFPMADGLLDYFPNALAEVSRLSKVANAQHNPGERMHWSRGKSTDHANKIVKHLIDRGKTDTDGIRHSAKVAWRALAMLQEELERDDGYPMPRNAWVDPPPPDYDPKTVAFPRGILQEAKTWGVYADDDTTEKSPPAETAYLASFAPNPHPMMAETLRDEYEKTNEGTGL